MSQVIEILQRILLVLGLVGLYLPGMAQQPAITSSNANPGRDVQVTYSVSNYTALPGGTYNWTVDVEVGNTYSMSNGSSVLEKKITFDNYGTYNVKFSGTNPFTQAVTNLSYLVVIPHPTVTYYHDFDDDQYGDPNDAKTVNVGDPIPTDHVADNTDCDDNDDEEKPGQTWYYDHDNDGLGSTQSYPHVSNSTVTSCTRPANSSTGGGWSTTSNDPCPDHANTTKTTYYKDADSDDYYVGTPVQDCDTPSGTGWRTGLTEGQIDLCDGNDAITTTYPRWYHDGDDDEFGDPNDYTDACSAPTDHVSDNTDCDDNDAAIKPNNKWYADTDGDGEGDSADQLEQCYAPSGYVADNNDCDDTDGALNSTTDWYKDADNDGFWEAVTADECNDPGVNWYHDSGDKGPDISLTMTVNNIAVGSGAIVNKGKTLNLSWSSVDPGGTYNVDLMRGETKVADLQNTVSTTSTYNIPSSLQTATNYRIRIKQSGHNNNWQYFSNFTISERPLTVTPTNMKKGALTISISWDPYEDDILDPLDINESPLSSLGVATITLLDSNNDHVLNIGSPINTTTETWTVPFEADPTSEGGYTIKVVQAGYVYEKTGLIISDPSDPVTITNTNNQVFYRNEKNTISWSTSISTTQTFDIVVKKGSTLVLSDSESENTPGGSVEWTPDDDNDLGNHTIDISVGPYTATQKTISVQDRLLVPSLSGNTYKPGVPFTVKWTNDVASTSGYSYEVLMVRPNGTTRTLKTVNSVNSTSVTIPLQEDVGTGFALKVERRDGQNNLDRTYAARDVTLEGPAITVTSPTPATVWRYYQTIDLDTDIAYTTDIPGTTSPDIWLVKNGTRLFELEEDWVVTPSTDVVADDLYQIEIAFGDFSAFSESSGAGGGPLTGDDFFSIDYAYLTQPTSSSVRRGDAESVIWTLTPESIAPPGTNWTFWVNGFNVDNQPAPGALSTTWEIAIDQQLGESAMRVFGGGDNFVKTVTVLDPANAVTISNAEGATFYKNENETIAWTTSIELYNDFVVEVFDPAAPASAIISETVSAKSPGSSYTWWVPDHLAPGTYQLKITLGPYSKTKNINILDRSLILPTAATEITVGVPFTVKWIADGGNAGGHDYEIVLVRPAGTTRILGTAVNLTSDQVTIPVQEASGDGFEIKVRRLNGGVHDRTYTLRDVTVLSPDIDITSPTHASFWRFKDRKGYEFDITYNTDIVGETPQFFLMKNGVDLFQIDNGWVIEQENGVVAGEFYQVRVEFGVHSAISGEGLVITQEMIDAGLTPTPEFEIGYAQFTSPTGDLPKLRRGSEYSLAWPGNMHGGEPQVPDPVNPANYTVRVDGLNIPDQPGANEFSVDWLIPLDQPKDTSAMQATGDGQVFVKEIEIIDPLFSFSSQPDEDHVFLKGQDARIQVSWTSSVDIPDPYNWRLVREADDVVILEGLNTSVTTLDEPVLDSWLIGNYHVEVQLQSSEYIITTNTFEIANPALTAPAEGLSMAKGSIQHIEWVLQTASTDPAGGYVPTDYETTVSLYNSDGTFNRSITSAVITGGHTMEWPLPLDPLLTAGDYYIIAHVTNTQTNVSMDYQSRIHLDEGYISLDFPEDGVIIAGTTMESIWSTNITGNTFDVELMNDEGLVATLEVGTSALTSFWHIPVNFEPRTDYRVRVNLSGTSYYDESNPPFTIDPPENQIEIFSPDEADAFALEEKLAITWIGTVPEAIYQVELLKNGVLQQVLANTTSFETSWVIPAQTPVGDDYQIRVSFGFSEALTGMFSIYEPQETLNRNFIKTFVAREEIAGHLQGKSRDKVTQSITYFDGLGRPEQRIQIEGSPEDAGNYNDIVQPITYDGFGRQHREYLPYSAANVTNAGAFRDQVLVDHRSYYDGIYLTDAPYAFSEQGFEASPANRVLSQAAPGEMWHLQSGHTVDNQYLLNDASDSVRILQVELGDTTISDYGFYGPGRLTKHIVTDENEGDKQGETTTYTNWLGQTVLKVVKISITSFAKTYYVYDDLGNLRHVIQPEGVRLMDVGEANGTNPNWTSFNYSGFREQWMFSYEYDHRNRMIAKRVPGAGWVYMVYDHRDRLVATQDGKQRETFEHLSDTVQISEYANKSYKNTTGIIELTGDFTFTASPDKEFIATTEDVPVIYDWNFTKYDHLNRPIVTGTMYFDGDRAALQAAIDAHYTAGNDDYEMYIGSSDFGGYSNHSFPTSYKNLLTVTYYDNYDFTSVGPASAAALPKAVGQVTGTLTRVLSETDWLTSVSFYDDRLRVIETVTDNHLGGNDVIATTYRNKVSGLAISTYRTHSDGSTTTTIHDQLSYDSQDRLIKAEHNINDELTATTLADIRYNDRGEMIEKNLGGNANLAQSVDYEYNIRGWLTRINGGANNFDNDGNDKFLYAIQYYSPTNPAAGYNQYNGNIGYIWWMNLGATNADAQFFRYYYDAASRFKFNLYRAISHDNYNHYRTDNVTYDFNGNIKSLRRTNGGTTLVDNLSYTYLGNQLTSVTDASGDSSLFLDGNTSGLDYTYDASGNMLRDKNKDITQINYNYLNLPELVVFGNGDYTSYVYDAAGTKLRTIRQTGANLSTNDYVGGIHYTDAAQQFIQHAEGRARWNGADIEYEYNLTDHLGNVRVTVDSAGSVVQADDYYPFGLRFNSSISEDNKYLYNGFELQARTGWFDYLARYYDPTIGRFMQVDPAADLMRRYSPYTYAFDNPIRFIDPDGMMPSFGNQQKPKGRRPTAQQLRNRKAVVNAIDSGLDWLKNSWVGQVVQDLGDTDSRSESQIGGTPVEKGEPGGMKPTESETPSGEPIDMEGLDVLIDKLSLGSFITPNNPMIEGGSKAPDILRDGEMLGGSDNSAKNEIEPNSSSDGTSTNTNESNQGDDGTIIDTDTSWYTPTRLTSKGPATDYEVTYSRKNKPDSTGDKSTKYHWQK